MFSEVSPHSRVVVLHVPMRSGEAIRKMTH